MELTNKELTHKVTEATKWKVDSIWLSLEEELQQL
jgi:hypothetical protein